MTRIAIPAALAALAVLGIGAAVASAGQSQYATVFKKFEFEASSSSAEKFSGKIDSNKSRCYQDRKVVTYRKKSGDKEKLGSDTTNDKGKFEIEVDGSLKDGKYFAEAKETTFKSDSGNKTTCLEAKSVKVDVNTSSSTY